MEQQKDKIKNMESYSILSDAEICSLVLSGQKEWFEVIVRRYNPVLYKIGRSYNFNHPDTQDLMQDSFIDAYKALAQFEGRSSFKTWLLRIMLNNCFKKKAKSTFKNEQMQPISNEAQPLFVLPEKATEERLHQKELGKIIEQALATIPEDYRLVFALREMNELNVADTAHLLHISEANVKTRLSRAKAMLRRRLEQSYRASELFAFNLVYCDAVVAQVMNRIHKL